MWPKMDFLVDYVSPVRVDVQWRQIFGQKGRAFRRRPTVEQCTHLERHHDRKLSCPRRTELYISCRISNSSHLRIEPSRPILRSSSGSERLSSALLGLREHGEVLASGDLACSRRLRCYSCSLFPPNAFCAFLSCSLGIGDPEKPSKEDHEAVWYSDGM